MAGKTAAGEGSNKDEFGAGIEDLVQINIQSFDTRFCEDLAGYWSSLDKDTKNVANVRPEEHADKAPEGKGWIIEIQGYTLHHRKQDFLRDTLLETLAAKGIDRNRKAVLPAAGAMPQQLTPRQEARSSGRRQRRVHRSPDIPPDGPIVNRISHVILYQKKQVTVSHKDTPFLIQSNLTELARGMTPTRAVSAASVGGRVVGFRAARREYRDGDHPNGRRVFRGAAGAGSRSNTGFRDGRNATARIARGQHGGGASPSCGRQSRLGGPGPMTRTPPPTPTPMRSGQTGQPGDVTENGIEHERTEFIILFIWREPTPSAPLRKEEKPPEITAPASSPDALEGPQQPSGTGPSRSAGGGGGGGGLRNLDVP